MRKNTNSSRLESVFPSFTMAGVLAGKCQGRGLHYLFVRDCEWCWRKRLGAVRDPDALGQRVCCAVSRGKEHFQVKSLLCTVQQRAFPGSAHVQWGTPVQHCSKDRQICLIFDRQGPPDFTLCNLYQCYSVFIFQPYKRITHKTRKRSLCCVTKPSQGRHNTYIYTPDWKPKTGQSTDPTKI